QGLSTLGRVITPGAHIVQILTEEPLLVLDLGIDAQQHGHGGIKNDVDLGLEHFTLLVLSTHKVRIRRHLGARLGFGFRLGFRWWLGLGRRLRCRRRRRRLFHHGLGHGLYFNWLGFRFRNRHHRLFGWWRWRDNRLFHHRIRRDHGGRLYWHHLLVPPARRPLEPPRQEQRQQ